MRWFIWYNDDDLLITKWFVLCTVVYFTYTVVYWSDRGGKEFTLSVYRSTVSSALKPNEDTRHAQCFHAQCFHRTRTGVTGAALHDLYRGSNVSVIITNPLYEGSSGDLSTHGSDDQAAGGACGYGPVSVEHHKTCRAPPEGEPSLTTAKPTTAKPATAKPTSSSFVKLFSFLWPQCWVRDRNICQVRNCCAAGKKYFGKVSVQGDPN